jgi:iron complex outermembrane receptor protein
LKTGLSYNFQVQDLGLFILWKSDSLAYQPQEGATNRQRSIRLNVDPYIKYIDKKNNVHTLKTRYYQVTTGNSQYVYTSAKAEMFYADYQYQRNLKKGELVLGSTSNTGVITSTVFENHLSNSTAIYGQLEQSFRNLTFTGGMRLEYFQQDDRKPDSEWNGLPFYPIFRAGAHYQLAKATHLRSAFGQGIRFPSIAERYVATSTGGVVIFPNPDLRPEKGWSAEIGAKQIFKIGNWRSMLDIAAFINEYSNMIEFTFGLYNPDGYPPTIDWLGFRAENAEAARITGIETSFNSAGKIGNVEIVSMIGYTYMNPVSLNNDPEYIYGTTGIGGFSDTSSRMLKYRFRHLAKADVEVAYKNVSCGVSMRYNSFMQNIDRIFEQSILGNFILPGLQEYRQLHNKGNLVFDLRFGYQIKEHYRLGFVVNNLFNAEYSSRPGDIQAPRNFILQFVYHLK